MEPTSFIVSSEEHGDVYENYSLLALTEDNIIAIGAEEDSNVTNQIVPELSTLLTNWGYENMLNVFSDHGITIDTLPKLTEEDLSEIFRGRRLVEKITFRQKLIEWKVQNNHPLAPSLNDTASLTSEFSLYVKNWLEKSRDSTCSTCSLQTPTPPSNRDGPKFDLLEVVKQFPRGEYVLNRYEEYKSLDDEARKILVEAIIAWHIKQKTKITRDGFENIAKDIQKVFGDDKEIYYKRRGSKQNPSGRLYDKYYNSTKRLNKLGIGLSVSQPTVSSNFSESFVSTSEIEDNNEEDKENIIAWLSLNNFPWEDVQKKWKQTFKTRRRQILDERDSSILTKWPLYKHSKGYNLVDLDFALLYKGKEYGLIRKWEGFKSDIVDIFNKKVKDKQNLHLLHQLNSSALDKDSTDLNVALLLHAILPPSIKHFTRKDNEKKVVTKCTIKDSQESFLLQVNCQNDIDKRIKDLASSIMKRGEHLQPFIIVVENHENKKKDFYVYYDEIKYKLENFVSAYDICFKIFHALNLRYPRPSENVWLFTQNFFYDIHLKEDNLSPNVLCLLKDMSKNLR